MTNLCFADLFFQSDYRLAIVAGGNRGYRRCERTGSLNALSLHLFQELRLEFRFFYEIRNCPSLGLVDLK